MSRIPQVLARLIEEFTGLFQQRLPGLCCGFYLVGSIALDSFDERFSDVDFIAIVNRQLEPSELAELGTIHAYIARKYPRWEMEGSYLQLSDLGRFDEQVDPYPHYHDGRLQLPGYYGLDSVTWWILKNRGVAVIGPDPGKLPFPVEWDKLIRRMGENLNTYWASWTVKPRRLAYLLSDWGIQWAVLGVLRQYYTFKENGIASKIQAGQYGLSCLPGRWERIIREALSIREGRPERSYRSRVARALDARAFLRYVIGYCNSFLIPPADQR